MWEFWFLFLFCFWGRFFSGTLKTHTLIHLLVQRRIEFLVKVLVFYLFCQFFSSAEEGSHQRNPPPLHTSSKPNSLLEDRRKSHIPEEFAGLLHGSSPACEPPETLYHLYSPKHFKYTPADDQKSLLQAPELSIVIGAGVSQVFSRTETQSSPQRSVGDSQKPQVVYRTIFHTKVNQDQAKPPNCDRKDPAGGWSTQSQSPSCCLGKNGEVPELQEIQTGGLPKDGSSGANYEERACTLGRMRSVPRSVLDLQLSKSLSKSDSNLVAVSPIQVSSY